VVVVGGGWAGFSAADALASSGKTSSVKVHLLDASPRGPGGLAAGWQSERLKLPVEAGLHGFWREYRNTFDAIERRIGLDLDDVLTPFTPSVLVSQSGRVAVAPVLGANECENHTANDGNSKNPLKAVADLLPSPLDLALLSNFSSDSPLTVADRVSALGLLDAWADFGQEDPASWERYDKISAENLFLTVASVTPTLYRELVSPLLHVLPMAPGYDCSAAAAMSCFHVFALQAKGAFDVRWCRGTITERIFDPWAEKLKSAGVDIRGGARVTSITEEAGSTRLNVTINDEESVLCDAIILAVGATAARRLLPVCPPIAAVPQTDTWKSLRGITCVAVRIFLRPEVSVSITEAMADSPVVVCGPKIGGIPQLTETGFCIYDLQRLQDKFSNSRDECFALEVDFFRADPLASVENDMEVAKLALRAVTSAIGADPIDDRAILDVSVVRARNAVSHFCVGSASCSPSIRLRRGIYACGDYVDRVGHASWSTEKAVVTGRQAALAFSADFGESCDAKIIPAAADSPQLATLRKLASRLRTVLPNAVLPASPLTLFRKMTGRGS